MADYFKTSDDSMAREVLIPSSLIQADLLSPTALASECFIKQQFSNKLQAYMIGYVNSIMSDYSVSL